MQIHQLHPDLLKERFQTYEERWNLKKNKHPPHGKEERSEMKFWLNITDIFRTG